MLVLLYASAFARFCFRFMVSGIGLWVSFSFCQFLPNPDLRQAKRGWLRLRLAIHPAQWARAWSSFVCRLTWCFSNSPAHRDAPQLCFSRAAGCRAIIGQVAKQPRYYFLPLIFAGFVVRALKAKALLWRCSAKWVSLNHVDAHP